MTSKPDSFDSRTLKTEVLEALKNLSAVMPNGIDYNPFLPFSDYNSGDFKGEQSKDQAADYDPEYRMMEEYEQILEMREGQQKVFDSLREALKNPETRAGFEKIAKASGFNTPEEYIANIEETLKKLG